jgi:D-tyrosyl-tRNA(Tyr) deacylase
MRAVIQRSKKSSVTVIEGAEKRTTGAIGSGLVVLLGVEDGDTQADAEYLAAKIAKLRIFEDEKGAMNLSVLDTAKPEALVISQFTLLGDARKGNRPSFMAAARPEAAIPLYEKFTELLRGHGIKTQTGEFGADMLVSIENDGPVTILLDSKKLF